MQIAVIIQNFSKDNSSFIRRVRRETDCDYLIALTDGYFSPDGVIGVPKQERIAWALEHGVDLILEKSICASLCDEELYASTAISLLDKLNISCALCLPCEVEDTGILYQSMRALLVTDQAFKNQIYCYIGQGDSFQRARSRILDRKIPGAGAALCLPCNNYALEYLKAAKYHYSSMVLRLMQVDSDCANPASAGDVSSDRRLYSPTGLTGSDPTPSSAVIAAAATEETAAYTAPIFTDNGFSELLRARLSDVNAIRPIELWGCTYTVARSIEEKLPEFRDFDSFCQSLAGDRHPAEDIRRILYRILLNITKPEFTVSSLHDHSLYAHVSGYRRDAQPLLELIRKKSQIPVLTPDTRTCLADNDSVQNMWELDARAAGICEAIQYRSSAAAES